MIENPTALITNDTVVLGILMTILGLIFITSSSEKPFKKFYSIVLRYCCAISYLHFQHLQYYIRENSSLYTIPHVIYYQFGFNLAASILLHWKLGSKAIIMFLAGTLGIILGGPWPYMCSIFPEVALSNRKKFGKDYQL
jgi:hypothetical protein